MSVHAGEPVTYIGQNGEVVRSYVSGPEGEPPIFEVPPHIAHSDTGPAFVTASRRNPALLSLSDEGTAWIRGHHNTNSEKARELLAIVKLVQSAA